jgi:Protein of unknown function (DUF998)
MASTTLSPSLQATKQVARIVTVAFVGITYFVVIIIALHFLRPDLNPIQRPTSEYAVGPFGWLMTSAFFSMSVASWALVIGLSQGVSQPARSRIGLGLVGLWGVGVLIAMFFPIDLDGAPQTMSGTIHAINGPLTFLSLTVGVILISRRFKHDETWCPHHRSTLILSLVMLMAFIGAPLAIATESGFAGLAQRMYLVTFVTWFLLTATRLRSVALGSGSA